MRRQLMQRRTLDIIVSLSGLVLAGLLVVLGLFLDRDASFAKSTVEEQLSQEKIMFPAVDKLTPEERVYTETKSGCLINYAGQQLVTGKQAECYANEYIGGHLKDPKKIPNANAMTFSELGTVIASINTQIRAARASNDPALADLEKRVADVREARELVWQGTMHRNALLTSYGFSVLGERAEQGMRIAFIAAGVLLLLSISGFVHAFVTPRTVAFAPVDAR